LRQCWWCARGIAIVRAIPTAPAWPLQQSSAAQPRQSLLRPGRGLQEQAPGSRIVPTFGSRTSGDSSLRKRPAQDWRGSSLCLGSKRVHPPLGTRGMLSADSGCFGTIKEGPAEAGPSSPDHLRQVGAEGDIHRMRMDDARMTSSSYREVMPDRKSRAAARRPRYGLE
jgi:hypothetical protein